jgi:4-amino-4-deoxy-L-arabinose transferase-like glycosyltransferase
MTARRALVLVIAISLVLRLLWVALMPPNKDEGYHYLYAVHPNWSYFDHPPMMMVVVRAGLEFCGGAVNNLSLRLGFVLLFAGSTWLLAGFTARWFGSWAGVYAAILWNLAPFFSLGAGGQAMPDGPFLFFALLTTAALASALIGAPGRVVPWVWVGLAWGGALLSKYHAVFLPGGAVLYVLLTPEARKVLRTPGPYLAVLIGAIVFLPVLYWNATHDWASFAFQARRAVGTDFKPIEVAKMLIGQIGFLTPWLWVALTATLVGLIRDWRRLTPIEQLLACVAVVPLTFFMLVSCVREVYPHWTLIGVMPLLPIVGRRCVDWAQRWPGMARKGIAAWTALLVGSAFLFAAHARIGLISLENDPAYDQSGWDSLAAELDQRGLVGQPGTFIFCSNWQEAGQISFALGNRTSVLCYNPVDAGGFAYWSRPADWVGQDGILVSIDVAPLEPQAYAPFFRRIDLVAEFSMTRGGEPTRPVRVYRCVEQLREFPFARDGDTHAIAQVAPEQTH